jgi:hypothetical protein
LFFSSHGFFFFLEVLQCWSLVLQLCAFFPHLLQRRGSSIALRNISTTSLQHFCNILLLSFFFFSHVPETIAIFFIATFSSSHKSL